MKSKIKAVRTKSHGTLAVLNMSDDLEPLAHANEPAKDTVSASTEEVSISTPCETADQLKSLPGNNKPMNAVDLIERLIDKELSHAAQILNLAPEELQTWISLQKDLTNKATLTLLRMVQKYHLDPLQEELALTQYENGHWQVFITVDDYAKLLNEHPAFAGMSFTESPERMGDIPTWIECSLYRTDRNGGITVREYFVEVMHSHVSWEKCLEGCCGTRPCSNALGWHLRLPHPHQKKQNLPLWARKK